MLRDGVHVGSPIGIAPVPRDAARGRGRIRCRGGQLAQLDGDGYLGPSLDSGDPVCNKSPRVGCVALWLAYWRGGRAVIGAWAGACGYCGYQHNGGAHSRGHGLGKAGCVHVARGRQTRTCRFGARRGFTIPQHRLTEGRGDLHVYPYLPQICSIIEMAIRFVVLPGNYGLACW